VSFLYRFSIFEFRLFPSILASPDDAASSTENSFPPQTLSPRYAQLKSSAPGCDALSDGRYTTRPRTWPHPRTRSPRTPRDCPQFRCSAAPRSARAAAHSASRQNPGIALPALPQTASNLSGPRTGELAASSLPSSAVDDRVALPARVAPAQEFAPEPARLRSLAPAVQADSSAVRTDRPAQQVEVSG